MNRRGRALIRLACPTRWPKGIGAACVGRVRILNSPHGVRYRIGAGQEKVVGLRLRGRRARRLRKAGKIDFTVRTRNVDAAFGTVTLTPVTVKRAPRR